LLELIRFDVYGFMFDGGSGSFTRSVSFTFEWGCLCQIRSYGWIVLTEDERDACKRDHITRVKNRLTRPLAIDESAAGGVQIEQDESTFDRTKLCVIS